MADAVPELMLTTLVEGAAPDQGWWYERKFDGIRLAAVRDGDSVRLFSRNAIDRAASFPEVVAVLREQPFGRFVVDGELVAFDGQVTSFGRLQQRSGIRDPSAARASGIDVCFYLFDVLQLDGVDLRQQPLTRRAALLADAFEYIDPLRWSDHATGEAPSLLGEACRRGWEGLVAKRVDSPYVSGRSRSWLKLKCVRRQELVIGGWTDPNGSRDGFGALLVGSYESGRLRYAGKVGTGFSARVLREVADALAGLRREDNPFAAGNPPLGGSHWVEPTLVCEVEFSEWTTAGRLRHPRFVGLRDDKAAATVTRERPVTGERRSP